MRHSTEPRFRKYVKRYGFLSFTRKFGDKCGKKLMDTATKTGIDVAKTPSKRVAQKTAEAKEDLIGKQKVKKKKKKDKKSTYHQKKDSKLLMTWDCFRNYIKMENEKITKLLGTMLDEVPRFIT